MPATPGTKNAARVIRLHAPYATNLENTRYVDLAAVLVWNERDGALEWQVDVPSPGDYQASVCCAVAMEGWQVEVSSASSRVGAALPKTEGFYWDRRLNFQRVPSSGVLNLPAGKVTINLRARQAVSFEVPENFWSYPNPTFLLRSLELTPMAGLAEIANEEQRARTRRASAAWLADCGYGVMFHWNSRSAPRHGPRKGYPDAVRDFDVAAFTEMVQRTGGKYVLINTGWADPCCPAPIQSWEKFFPGWTARRDLIADVAEGLGRHGVRLMLYFPSHVLVWGEDYQRLDKTSPEELMDVHREILTEMGRRYGRSVSGYWFDGWGFLSVKFPGISDEEFFDFCKIGNPDRIIALSNWIFPLENPWQDYFAGDLGTIENPPKARYIEDGPGKGIPQHCAVTIDEPNWAHEALEAPIARPRFTDEQLTKYIQACLNVKVPVTLNMGILQDGKAGEATISQLEVLRRQVRGE